MEPITLGIICFLVGGLIGGGVVFGVDKANDKDTVELVEAIGQLKDNLAEGQKQVQINLTDQDLLKVACSAEWMKDNTDSLCREMFCRMQNRGLDKGATNKECENIAHVTNSKARLQTCMDYWDETTILEGGGLNLNSKYSQCMSVFKNRE
jgi:hypothetical protein